MKISGIILAGGKSSRLGFNKLKIKIGNIPLFIDMVVKLSYFCSEIIVSTSVENMQAINDEIKNINQYFKNYESLHLTIPGVVIAEDIDLDTVSCSRQNGGPTLPLATSGALKGIYSSLLKSSNQYCIVTASDMPFLSYKLLKMLCDNISNKAENKKADMVLIKNPEGYEALCAVYSRKCIHPIERNLLKGMFRITDILPFIDTRLIGQGLLKKLGIDPLNFFNINTSDDYKSFKEKWDASSFRNSEYDGDGFIKKWNEFFFR